MNTKLLVLLSLGAMSCATIINHGKAKVHIESEPAGAIVSVDGTRDCLTPCDVTLDMTDHGHEVSLALDGYVTASANVDRTFDYWCFGNLCLGGLPGGIVDLATGSWKGAADKGEIKVTLIKAAAPAVK